MTMPPPLQIPSEPTPTPPATNGSRPNEQAALADLDQYVQPPDFVRRTRLTGPPTWILLALVLAAGTFILGASLGKQAANDAASTASATAVTSGFGGRAGSGAAGSGFGNRAGAGAGTGGAGGATIGSVQLVDGTNVYIQTTAGAVIKVTTGAGSTFNVSKPGAITDLKPGAFVSVQGAPGPDGTVAATAISQVAAGGFRGGSGGATATTSGTRPGS